MRTEVMARRSVRSARRAKIGDVAIVVGRTADQVLQVLRRRAEGHPVEMGTIRPLEEGKPIDGEVVTLEPRKDVPLVYDVKTELADPRRATTDGPPQVATEEYRRGWETIWGRSRGGKPN